MSSKVSKLVRIALAASIAASGAIATTALTATTAQAATSSVDGKITRGEIITRAQFWMNKSIPYTQGGSYADSSGRSYRTDCSGYVSMAWHLGTSANTQSLPGYSYEISRADLKPGDILNSYYDHVILFDHWDDAAHTKFSYYSFGSTPVKHVTGVSINAATFDSHPNGDYKALRYKNVVDDPTGNRVAVSMTGGVAHVGIVGSDGAMYNSDGDYAGSGWSGRWDRIESSGLRAVTSVSSGSVVHVFALGANGQVFGKDADYASGRWSDWAEVPGGAAGATALTASMTGSTVHLEIVGADGAMYNTDGDYAGSGWSGRWDRLGSSGLKALSSVSSGSVVHVFALGANGQVFGKDADYASGRWSDWAEVPGGAAGATAVAASMTGSTVHLGIVGSDGSLYNTDGDYAGVGWSGTWSQIRGERKVTSLASTSAGGVVHTFAIGTDNRVYGIDGDYNTGRWSTWSELPGGASA
ncbi:hypothetical protein [Kitasatospora sp. NPDC094015]|uniref:hypothetical protein n=1 Tax=Kitasatospora sp. NPDC094015 TaxID=3155205 RepID=UPI0033238932